MWLEIYRCSLCEYRTILETGVHNSTEPLPDPEVNVRPAQAASTYG
jgi:hypothetical protein